MDENQTVEEIKTEEATLEESDGAKLAIEQEKKERSQRCHQKIQQALAEENCTIDVMMILKSGKVIPQADIVAK